jgi:hypothetical protein
VGKLCISKFIENDDSVSMDAFGVYEGCNCPSCEEVRRGNKPPDAPKLTSKSEFDRRGRLKKKKRKGPDPNQLTLF